MRFNFFVNVNIHFPIFIVKIECSNSGTRRYSKVKKKKKGDLIIIGYNTTRITLTIH